MRQCGSGRGIEEVKVLCPQSVGNAFPHARPYPHMRYRHQQLSRYRQRHVALVSEPLIGNHAGGPGARPAKHDAMWANADHDLSAGANRLSDLRSEFVVAEAEARTVVELERRPLACASDRSVEHVHG